MSASPTTPPNVKGEVKTPRVDAVENAEAWRDPEQWLTELQVSWGFARQLERECDAWKEYAQHQEHCATCGEAVSDCEEGSALRAIAESRP